jgi:hypothetical protein
MRDTEVTQSQVAYEISPKEKNTNRRMPQGDKQFGKEAKTMPQTDNKPATKKGLKTHKHHVHRHKEHR